MPYYIKYLTEKYISIAVLHLLLGYCLIKISGLSTIISWTLIVIGFHEIIKSKDKYHQAAIFAGYLVGMEIVLRMTNANVFWEFGKYGVILFLITGIISKQTKKLNLPFLMLIYFLSLLPSIVLIPYPSFNEWRQIISFNLSGPVTLFISVLYFRGKSINHANVVLILRAIALPILTLSTILLFRLPTMEELTFSSEANYQFSGGYGPNQVSSMLGVLIVLIGLSKINQYSFFNNQILDYSILGLCIIQALLTFSRGGFMVALGSLAFSWVISIKQNKQVKKVYRYNMLILIIIVISLWNIAADFTGGIMTDRYKTTLEFNEQGIIGGSSRVEIMLTDIEIFLDNFILGVGPGMGKYLRIKYTYGKIVSAHSEFTRILAEHGIVGLIGIASLIFFTYKEYFKRISISRVFFICFILVASMTMLHSAMRLAMPGFLFGLAYISIPKTELRLLNK
tara:strand:+ start:193 stop:1551 length:1359 start_codon:yes stop_codon:yes gene_type:complete